MIKKLKRRYLITNMALLSSTLIVCLAVLFGFLYHSQIASSYAVMQEMMKQSEIPGGGRPAPRPPEAEPQAYTYSAGESDVIQLNFDPNAQGGDQNGGQQPWEGFDPSKLPNPWEQPWMFPWMNPWANPWAQPWQDPNWNQGQNQDPNAQGNQQQNDPDKEDRKNYEEQKRPVDDDDDRIEKREEGRIPAQNEQHPAETAPPQPEQASRRKPHRSSAVWRKTRFLLRPFRISYFSCFTYLHWKTVPIVAHPAKTPAPE